MNGEERARRVGENEALFRVVNERIESLNVAFASITETMDVVCECGDLECAERVVLSVSDYERVREDPTHFVLLPGHRSPVSRPWSRRATGSSSSGSTRACPPRWRARPIHATSAAPGRPIAVCRVSGTRNVRTLDQVSRARGSRGAPEEEDGTAAR